MRKSNWVELFLDRVVNEVFCEDGIWEGNWLVADEVMGTVKFWRKNIPNKERSCCWGS